MSNETVRLSVPVRESTTPRKLSSDEVQALISVADVLCAGDGSLPLPSALPTYRKALATALVARIDAFWSVVNTLSALPSGDGASLADHLRNMHSDRPEAFQPLSAIAAGAYLLTPEVSAAIGYEGQIRNYPGLEDAVDDLSDGILEPVIERGERYIEA